MVNEPIWGLAILKAELFVMTIYRPDIVVYDTVSFECQRTLTVDSTNFLRDLVSSTKNHCLFAVEDAGQGIQMDLVPITVWLYRVEPVGGQIVAKWDVGIETRNLSVSGSGNVLVTCNGCVKEFNADGTLLRSISLPDGVNIAWQTFQLDAERFVVCQGWEDFGPHQVFFMNCAAQLLAGHDGNQCNSGPLNLNNPVYMDVDGRDGCILVADSGNHRICLMSPHLVRLRDLLTESDGIFEPYRIVLDLALGRLYVGTNSKKIFVFRIA